MRMVFEFREGCYSTRSWELAVFVVVQDLEKESRHVWLTNDNVNVAREFVDGMRYQFPGSKFSVHYAENVIDRTTPHQIGEDFPLDPRLIDGRLVRSL